MSDAAENAIRILLYLFLGLTLLSFIFLMINTDKSWEKSLGKQVIQGNTCYYDLYKEPIDTLLTPAQVYTQIKASDGYTVRINGMDISEEYLQGIKENDRGYVRWLLSSLRASSYRKTTVFNSSGNIVYIDYISN